jgi:hypothetical protein
MCVGNSPLRINVKWEFPYESIYELGIPVSRIYVNWEFPLENIC